MPLNLSLIAAPMVNQSDLPFRILTSERYGATTVYSQMLHPEKLLQDQDYLEFHRRDLQSQTHRTVSTVVQLCGNNLQAIVEAGKKIQDVCDAIDLNLGCPQQIAKDEHFGAYLLGRKDWPLVENIVSSMSRSLMVPISTKIRLCQPSSNTVELAERLQASGSSWITLHARTVSSRRRRQGAADLSQVRLLKQSEQLTIPIISNGNVRVFDDISKNLEYTGADGLMVGETLLGNPCIFSNRNLPDPVDISLEYLSICCEYPEVATLKTIQTHIRHFIGFQCSRRPWFKKFRSALNACSDLEDIELLLRVKVQRWRGQTIKSGSESDSESVEMEGGTDTDIFDLSLHGTSQDSR
ncbi:FMN-linked oxidoreductase [Rhodocollybia butyracea]|uniref:tRNA-dihydrouridine synthase n=1 Tax=Rhodocollybia butyracea TaxID=206335 RepID=A0A9P5QBG3_9AGAR|nr:FMN-linked oxidoreductase [Rhodocollybia butyracea]